MFPVNHATGMGYIKGRRPRVSRAMRIHMMERMGPIVVPAIPQVVGKIDCLEADDPS